VLLNPEIIPLPEVDGSLRGRGPEGACLYWVRGVVPRYAHIRYRGLDPLGQAIEREADGFHARVVQHEVDHLIGRLYPTRMRDLTKLGYTSVLFPASIRPDE
jgi:peptide deformylase